MAGYSSVSCSKSCFTDVAESSNSATPPVSCARFPTKTTRAMCDLGLAEALLLEGLEHLGRRHGQLGEADARGVLHGIRDGPQRRDDGRLPHATHAVRMLRVRHLHEHGVNHRHVRGYGHTVVEEARVLELAVLAVDVLLIEGPADSLHGSALILPLDVGGMQRAAGVLGYRVAQDRRAPCLRIDLEIDEVRAEARPRPLRVEAADASDGSARLARDLGEVGDGHGLHLLGESAEGPDGATGELDLLWLGLPQLAGPRAELALDLLRRLHDGHGTREGRAAAPREEVEA